MYKEDSQPLQRVCPVCDQDNADLFWTKGEMRLVKCRECSIVFANPVAREFASGSFYQRLAKPFYLSAEKLQSDYAAVRFERELRVFRSFCASGHLLDVGCSTGGFLYQLGARWPGQYEALGTDIAVDALKYAESQGVRVLRESFLDCEPGQGRFDAISFWAVLEHLIAPGKFLAQAAELLKPGGHCFILVPNFQSLAVRLLGARYRYVMAEHVNYFTKKTLLAFASREPRLKPVKLTSSHFNPVILWQDWKKAREKVPDEERARLLKRTTEWKQKPALGPVRVVYGLAERTLGWFKLADNLVLVLRRKAS